jgi:flavin-dependent dehydrogenase
VSRKLLDEYMISLLPENVTVRKNCRYLSHQRTGEGISVKLRAKETIETIKCRLLVGADGASSRVRRNLYNDFSKRRKYLAIQGEYKRLSNINHYAVFFDREITDFYSWLIPKDESIIIGGAFLEKDKPRLKFEKLITKLRSEYYYFGAELKISACYIIRPRLQDIKIGENNIALIGEAAGFISPSSSEGISYAYRSALALTKSLDEMDDVWLRRYRQNTFKLRVNILLKIIKSFFMYNYFLRNIIFKTRIGSLRSV